jgi:hypothetical protein
VESVGRCHICPNMTNSSWQALLEMLEALQMTLELIYRVFYRMIFIIQRVWIKACREDCFFDWIWISTAHIVSTSCKAVCARDHVHHHRYFTISWSKISFVWTFNRAFSRVSPRAEEIDFDKSIFLIICLCLCAWKDYEAERRNNKYAMNPTDFAASMVL